MLMSTVHQNIDERVAELERLVREQARQIEQLRTDLKNVKSKHNSRVLSGTAVNTRLHSR
jgi:predicted RNase H-like nuclease (RuvC/YqgF family)